MIDVIIKELKELQIGIFLVLGSVIIGTLVIVFLIFELLLIVDYCFLSKSYCEAIVNGISVYKGRCHFLDISSIGENGNTKQLLIYEDILKLKNTKQYIHNNIEIKSIERGE